MLASLRRTFALAIRIVRQFVRDRRTLALLFRRATRHHDAAQLRAGQPSSTITLAIVAPSGPAGAVIRAPA